MVKVGSSLLGACNSRECGKDYMKAEIASRKGIKSSEWCWKKSFTFSIFRRYLRGKKKSQPVKYQGTASVPSLPFLSQKVYHPPIWTAGTRRPCLHDEPEHAPILLRLPGTVLFGCCRLPHPAQPFGEIILQQYYLPRSRCLPYGTC